MFVRKVIVRNSVCFQIGKKEYGRFILIKHVGCALISSKEEVELLRVKARGELFKIISEKQASLFPLQQVEQKSRASLTNWHITGFHQVFGKVYDAIGFPNNLLRDLVIGRIVYPKSKLSTIRYFDRYLGISLSKDRVYRFMDRMDKEKLVAIAFSFVCHKGSGVSLAFYDVTTLHFETEKEDDLRKKGFSKNHRSDLPQILLGLFVDSSGYPFDFDAFEGNSFEGHTFEKAVNKLCSRYNFKDLTVVADAAMLSANNLSFLEKENINYIVGARLRNLPNDILRKILGNDFQNDPFYKICVGNKNLIVDFSSQRQKRDRAGRERQIKKLETDLASNRQLVRKSKYLLVQKTKVVGIDQKKIAADEVFDGLKGYFTNLANTLEPNEVINQYHNLWKIEKAFRMSKNDLRERPIYHWNLKRIKAHLLVCFVSLLVMKETEAILKEKGYSLTRAIEVLGKVGQGQVRIGNTTMEIGSELDQEAKSVLRLFEGH